MIGGLMLLSAVGAMVLIAWWSLPRDDAEDPATGLLALRGWSERTVVRKHDTANRRNRRPVAKTKMEAGAVASGEAGPRKRDRRPDAATRRRRR